MAREIPATAVEIRRRLQVRFGRSTGAVAVPEHLVLFEVGARESTWRKRRIDVVAVGMLKRTCWLIHGFEIKVSRADLRSELNERAKAESGAQYCDRWWLALSSIDLLRERDDIPERWGLIACSGRRLRVYRQPLPIDRIESPEFRAALLHAGQRSPGYRRAMGYQAGLQRGIDVSRPHIDAAYQRGFHHGKWSAQHEVEEATA